MKYLLIGLLLFFPGCTLAGAPREIIYGANLATLSVSMVPRIDIYKIEVVLPDTRFGLSASALALRQGDWRYSVRDRSYDRWGNLTSESGYTTKSKFLTDLLPVGVFFAPYAWTEANGVSGNIRLFYEYSSTWLKNDLHDLSVSCSYGDNSLAKRTTQDYGVIFDSGGALRFKAGRISMKRGASSCDDSDATRVLDFGPLNTSKWYAGFEVLFGGISEEKKVSFLGGARPGLKENNRASAATDFVRNYYSNYSSSDIDEERTLAMAKPARLKVSDIRFADTGNKKGLVGGDSAVISMRLNNTGGLAGNIKALVSHKGADVKIPVGFSLGDLATGEDTRLEIPVKSNYDMKEGTVSVNISFQEENGNPPDPVVVTFRTFKLVPPDFKIIGISIDDGAYKDTGRLAFGNGNGVLEPGESAEISVILKNKGGEARDVYAELGVEKEPEIRILENKGISAGYKVGKLESAGWRELKFAVSVSRIYKVSEKLPLYLSVSEQRPDFEDAIELPIAVNEALPLAQKVNISPESGERHKAVPAPTFGEELLAIPEGIMGTKKDSVAVVIGVKNYSSKYVPSVDYALNDAALVREYLIRTMGYREDNVIYLENPGKADIEKVFGNKSNYRGQLYDYVKEGKSDVFVYYTGHGAPDLDSKEAYFVPSDSDPNYVRFGGYPLSVFYENLSKLRAREVNVVIDACFSGISDKGTIITKASPLLVVPVIPGAGKINIFTSSKAEQISSWYPEKRHSLFTYFFLRGIQGAADRNKDKSVTYGELYEYVSENVPYYARRLYGRTQNPSFIGKEKKIFLRY